MKVLWKYLKPHRTLVFLSLLLAAGAQRLNLLDPVIFGKIIDDYATNKNNLQERALMKKYGQSWSTWQNTTLKPFYFDLVKGSVRGIPLKSDEFFYTYNMTETTRWLVAISETSNRSRR